MTKWLGLRNLSIYTQCRQKSTTLGFKSDYSHVVVGGGVVGLAIAAELSTRFKTLLLEKNPDVGMETSSRNSEVIHAGLYYPSDSLKTKLCIEGNRLLYGLDPAKTGVKWKKCGKWIVAQNDIEESWLETIYSRVQKYLGIPVEMWTPSRCKIHEPAITVRRGALVSPTSGIVDSHGLMRYLKTKFGVNGGDVSLGTEVVDIDFNGGGYRILCKDTFNLSGEEVVIRADNLVNAAGLQADKISNMLLPLERHKKHYYYKGNYYKATYPIPPVKRLIYPAVASDVMTIGTHLTIDLDGNIRFGPDLEFVDEIDYKVNPKNIPAAYKEIVTYYPHIRDKSLVTDYSGLRPLIRPHGSTHFQDFYIEHEVGFPGFVNLLSIESPGLTSSLAIGKYVKEIYCK